MREIQSAINRLTPLLTDLTMAQSNYLEQFLRDLSTKVDRMQESLNARIDRLHDDLRKGQRDIGERVTRLEVEVQNLQTEFHTHTEWADAQSEKIARLEQGKDQDRVRMLLDVHDTKITLSWWSWIAGGVLTGLGAALTILWQAVTTWWSGGK